MHSLAVWRGKFFLCVCVHLSKSGLVYVNKVKCLFLMYLDVVAMGLTDYRVSDGSGGAFA